MNQSVIVLVLAIVALLLGGIEVIRSKAQSLLAWGLVAVAIAVVLLAK